MYAMALTIVSTEGYRQKEAPCCASPEVIQFDDDKGDSRINGPRSSGVGCCQQGADVSMKPVCPNKGRPLQVLQVSSWTHGNSDLSK